MKRRWLWVVYGAGTVVVLLSLAWMSALVLRLERGEAAAQAQTAHQEALRLALWRMDSWFAPRLAREAARPFFDYEPFYPQQRAYTKLLYEIQPGEVLVPSPLLSFRSDIIRLHFERLADGTFRSPQVPRGNLRDLAEAQYLALDRIEGAAGELLHVETLLDARTDLESCVNVAESHMNDPSIPPLLVQPETRRGGPAAGQLQQQLGQEYWVRNQQTADFQTAFKATDKVAAEIPHVAGTEQPIDVGPFVALWTGAGSEPGEPGDLIFVRRVRVAEQEMIQGFLCDWPTLRGHLLEQVSDLFSGPPGAWLEPVPDEARSSTLPGTMMATIPAALRVATPELATLPMMSPARWTLLISTLVVLAGLIVAAAALRASVTFGERRSRFASAVTHELRTPLTTFRMYTEMLADGMVPEGEKRQRYLHTLRDESARLANLVENVLSYARLEDAATRAGPA
jgi:hypothetical protein